MLRHYPADVTQAAGINGLKYFWLLLKLGQVESPEAIYTIADRTIRYLSSSQEQRGGEAEQLQLLQRRWYANLRGGNGPDFDVYREPEYLAEAWACWSIYSRKYIRALQKTPPASIHSLRLVVDLGNGLGLSSAALKQTYPDARVVGTNLPATNQWRIASICADSYGFEMKEKLEGIGSADLVFASEYFEHFEEPIGHLGDVIEALTPRILVIANSFSSDAIGHFDSYLCDGITTSKKATGRKFNDALRASSYSKVETGFWNNRPSVWVRQCAA